MQTAQLILEYLKGSLSSQVVAGVISLLLLGISGPEYFFLNELSAVDQIDKSIVQA